MAGESAAISCASLVHSYDGKRRALDGVSFEVRRGEVFGLLGRNGAGKSTLIKAMTTLVTPTSGELRVLGLDPRHDGRRIRERIGVVQQGESFDFTTVEGNLEIYGMLWGVPKEERRRRCEALLERFGIAEIRRRRSFDLSGGQKRRVQVAREFMHDMEILFLDEPTVGLDVLMRRTLLDSVRDAVRQGLTVVFTTHNLEEADYLCDRVAVIDLGRVIVADSVANLKRLYSGKKTVDVTADAEHAEPFFARLRERSAGRATLTVQGAAGTILTDDPKATLGTIVEVAQGTGATLEWLNVRGNTLEDVFLSSVATGGRTNGATQPP
ncbi:MAG TPA: ABC transporter ATP-binding protein [Thermoplasmata archaeon]|nr:ABC transporter ATP-binding protein [Thermoplasmata archaeon]